MMPKVGDVVFVRYYGPRGREALGPDGGPPIGPVEVTQILTPTAFLARVGRAYATFSVRNIVNPIEVIAQLGDEP